MGDSAIWSVYITHVDRDYFGDDDLLGRYFIPVGDEMRVEPRGHQGYCMFDTLITFEDGIRIERTVDAIARSAYEGRWVEVAAGHGTGAA